MNGVVQPPSRPPMTEADMAFYYWFHQFGSDGSIAEEREAFAAGWNARAASPSAT